MGASLVPGVGDVETKVFELRIALDELSVGDRLTLARRSPRGPDVDEDGLAQELCEGELCPLQSLATYLGSGISRSIGRWDLLFRCRLGFDRGRRRLSRSSLLLGRCGLGRGWCRRLDRRRFPWHRFCRGHGLLCGRRRLRCGLGLGFCPAPAASGGNRQ